MFPYLGEEMIRVFMEYLNRPRNQGPQTGNEACTDHVRYVESDGDSDSRCRSVPGVAGWNKPPSHESSPSRVTETLATRGPDSATPRLSSPENACNLPHSA
jgi:hypothetical protein